MPFRDQTEISVGQELPRGKLANNDSAAVLCTPPAPALARDGGDSGAVGGIVKESLVGIQKFEVSCNNADAAECANATRDIAGGMKDIFANKDDLCEPRS